MMEEERDASPFNCEKKCSQEVLSAIDREDGSDCKMCCCLQQRRVCPPGVRPLKMTKGWRFERRDGNSCDQKFVFL